jgi:hypothetical protein
MDKSPLCLRKDTIFFENYIYRFSLDGKRVNKKMLLPHFKNRSNNVLQTAIFLTIFFCLLFLQEGFFRPWREDTSNTTESKAINDNLLF